MVELDNAVNPGSTYTARLTVAVPPEGTDTGRLVPVAEKRSVPVVRFHASKRTESIEAVKGLLLWTATLTR